MSSPLTWPEVIKMITVMNPFDMKRLPLLFCFLFLSSTSFSFVQQKKHTKKSTNEWKLLMLERYCLLLNKTKRKTSSKSPGKKLYPQNRKCWQRFTKPYNNISWLWQTWSENGKNNHLFALSFSIYNIIITRRASPWS